MSSDEHEYGPRKITTFIPFSQELVAQYMRPSIIERLMRPDDRTDEQRAADRAKRDAERAALRAVIERRHAQILGAAEHPLLRSVLELHAPVFGDYDFTGAHCEGCEANGYESEYAEFPCQTYALIAPTAATVGCACDCHTAHSYGMACSLPSPCCEYAGSDSGGTQ